MNKKFKYDGKSRPVTNLYKKNFDRIFGVKSKDGVQHDHVNKDHANSKEKNENKS